MQTIRGLWFSLHSPVSHQNLPASNKAITERMETGYFQHLCPRLQDLKFGGQHYEEKTTGLLLRACIFVISFIWIIFGLPMF
jgi:hypothetical protein